MVDESRLHRPVRFGVVKRVAMRNGQAQIQIEPAGLTGYVESVLLQNHGLVSYPPEGAKALILQPGTHSGGFVVLCPYSAAETPADIEPGETILYASSGQQIRLMENGDIHLRAASGGLIRVSGDTHIEGKVTIAGSAQIEGSLEVAEKTQLNGDLHAKGSVALGGDGGTHVARVGDKVQVTPSTGIGSIIQGARKTRAQ